MGRTLARSRLGGGALRWKKAEWAHVLKSLDGVKASGKSFRRVVWALAQKRENMAGKTFSSVQQSGGVLRPENVQSQKKAKKGLKSLSKKNLSPWEI